MVAIRSRVREHVVESDVVTPSTTGSRRRLPSLYDRAPWHRAPEGEAPAEPREGEAPAEPDSRYGSAGASPSQSLTLPELDG